MSLAANGEDGNGLQLEKLRLNFSSRFRASSISDHGLFSLCELRSYLPLDVQRKCSEWIKLATLISRIAWAKNPRDPREVAPVK